MKRDNPMAIVTLNAIRLAVVAAILGSCSFAQNQDSNDAHVKRKWLLCDASWMFTPYEVGSDFSVMLSFRQGPLPGIRVTLTPSGELEDGSGHRRATVTAITDSSGTAHFLAVPAGEYTAGAKNGLLFHSNEVTVHADGEFDKEIAIEWPLNSLPVRSLRGNLIAPSQGTNPDRPLDLATVKLMDLRSSRVLETQRTSADGSYVFSAIEPGLYVVRIIPPASDKRTKPASGDLAIELDPAAQESTIPEMKVLQSDCAGVQLLRRIGKDRWEAP